jgi:molybdopterin-guanine dinucleotide biosynthesis protein A
MVEYKAAQGMIGNKPREKSHALSDRIQEGFRELPITAAILNGGKARRFGGIDKQTLEIDGIALGVKIAQALRSVVQELLIIGKPHAMYQTSADGQFLDDARGRGPLSGLVCALIHAKFDWVLLCASDMPFVSQQLIRYLYDKVDSGDSESVVCEYEAVIQPFFALYHRTLLKELMVTLETDKHSSMQQIILRGKHKILKENELTRICNPRLMFCNINDNASYQEALRLSSWNGFLENS